MARTLQALVAQPSLEAFLAQELAVVSEQLHALRSRFWFYDRVRNKLYLQMSYDMGRVIPGVRDHSLVPLERDPQDFPLWLEIARSRQPLIISDIASDARLAGREYLLERGVRASLQVPLLLGDEVAGLLAVYRTEQHFEPKEIELAQSLAQAVTLAQHLNWLAEQGRQAAILEERTRIAGEIHDTLAQGLTGVIIQLEAAEDALIEAPGEVLDHLTRARALARASLTEARRSVQALRPGMLEGCDLPTALGRLAQEAGVDTAVRIGISVEGRARSLSPGVENNLLRIAQEAVANALQHADATTVRIELTFEEQGVRLIVRDDGRGFDPNVLPTDGAFGIEGMRRRAERIDGSLIIASEPQAGTTVKVLVPGEFRQPAWR